VATTITMLAPAPGQGSDDERRRPADLP
jgi:hypothetical protein